MKNTSSQAAALSQNEIVQRPSLRLHLSELPRALRIRRSTKLKLASQNIEAAIHPKEILVIPGLLASPWSTELLRGVLSKAGHTVYDWELGRNLGRISDLDKLSAWIQSWKNAHNENLEIIGWSLGGIYARRLAMIHNEDISQVITLCSPYRDVHAPNYARWVFNLVQSVWKEDTSPEWLNQLAKPIETPSVAFYSKSDGIVPWQACHDPNDFLHHQNIEAYSPHIGVGMDYEVIMKILSLVDRRH